MEAKDTIGVNEGFLTFSNIMFIISGLGISIASIALLLIYMPSLLVNLLKIVSFNVIETLFYLVCFYAIYGIKNLFVSDTSHYVALIVTMIVILASYHSFAHRFRTTTVPMYTFNMIFYMICAIYYDSKMFGYIATMALMGMLHFNVFLGGLSFGFGYDSTDIIPSSTLSAGVVMSLGYYFKLHPIQYSDIFTDGMIWIASFVFYIGVLILSSHFYYQKFDSVYAQRQFLALVVFLLPMYNGFITYTSSMSTMSTIFLVFYLLDKYAELMPSNIKAHFWGLFTLSLSVYLINYHYRYY